MSAELVTAERQSEAFGDGMVPCDVADVLRFVDRQCRCRRG
jgi:hypothetical protein